MKRRDFFKVAGQAGTAGLTLSLLPVLSSKALAAETVVGARSAELSKSWFEQYLNQNFWVKTRGLTGSNLMLIEVRERPASPGLEQFNVVFQALQPGKRLLSGIYTVLDPDGGSIKLHLEPKKTDGMVFYHATFNLLTHA